MCEMNSTLDGWINNTEDIAEEKISETETWQ